MNVVFRKLFPTPYACLSIVISVLLVSVPISTVVQFSKVLASELNKPTEGAGTKTINQELLGAILVNSKDPASQHKQNSIQYNSKELELAIQSLSQEVAANPNNKFLYHQRGFLHYRNGELKSNRDDFEQAIKDFSKVIDLDEKDDIAYLNRGLSYYKIYILRQTKEDFARATENIIKAIQINPRSWLEWLREQRRNSGLQDLKEKFNHAITQYMSGKPTIALGEMKNIQSKYLCDKTKQKDSEIKEFCNKVYNCINAFKKKEVPSENCPANLLNTD